MARGERVALGVRVKSGYAIAVAVSAAPHLIARTTLDLADPAKPDLRQPYHAGMGRLEENAGLLATRARAIGRTTAQHVRAWLRELQTDGHDVRGVGLVVGSLIDPSTVGSPHIRAHAFEGQLFRSVLDRAFREHGLTPVVFVERRLYADAVDALKQPESSIRATLASLGKRERPAKRASQAAAADADTDTEASPRPWRADEKLAALGAWLTFAQDSRSRPARR